VFTLRCTRKLLRRLGATPSSEAIAPSTVLGDWTANLLYTRPQQLVLAMNERSLLCVLVPAAPGERVGLRLREAVAELLLEIGVPAGAVKTEVQAMEPMAIGATASRAILGCMNDAAFQLSQRRAPGVSLRDLGLQLAENIYSLTDYQPPRHRALEFFGVAGGGMVPIRGRVLH
jgi:hypothetical protein